MQTSLKPVVRPAGEGDFEFCFDAKKQALGPYIISRWGWEEAYQRSVHLRRWQEKPWSVVELHGGRIGTLSLQEEATSARFGEFYLLPEHQRQGLGSALLADVLERCDAAQREVRLEYLKWNPVASLYRRHGFEIVGENDTHYFMIRRAITARS